MQPNRPMQATLVAPSLSAMVLSGPSQRTPFGNDLASDMNQQRWISLCAARLGELRPLDDEDEIAALAADLFNDVSGYDPQLAAEMEYETLAALA